MCNLKNKFICIVLFVSLIVVGVSNITVFADDSTNSYSFNSSFASEQGVDGWYYMRVPTSDPFAESACASLSYRTNSVYGKYIWSRSGNPPYILKYNITNPDGTYSDSEYTMISTSSQAASGAGVIKWKAPKSGFISVSTLVPLQKEKPESASVICYVYHKNNLLWSGNLNGAINQKLEMPEMKIFVQQDDCLYFTIKKESGNNDTVTVFTPEITYFEKNSYNSKDDFSSMTGNLGWYYLYSDKTTEHSEDAYNSLMYSNMLNQWQITEFDYINPEKVSAMDYKVAYMWVSSLTGKLKVKLDVDNVSNNSVIKLYKNNVCIMTYDGTENEICTNFKNGDKLYCVIENGSADLNLSFELIDNDYEVTHTITKDGVLTETFQPGDQIDANIVVTDKVARGKDLFVAFGLINSAGMIKAETHSFVANSNIDDISLSINIPEDEEGGELFLYVWEKFPSLRPVFKGYVLQKQ